MSDYEFDVLKNREVPFQNRPLERAPAKIAVFLNKTVVLRLGLNSHINSQNSEYGRDT